MDDAKPRWAPAQPATLPPHDADDSDRSRTVRADAGDRQDPPRLDLRRRRLTADAAGGGAHPANRIGVPEMSAVPDSKLIDAAAARLDAAAGQAPAADDGVVLLQASMLRPQPVTWLWPDWLALGKLHVLAGAPGQGKTTLALAFAATISTGGRWPDRSRCEPGSVLICSGEDDPADTLLPRLIAMGADASRIYFVSGTRAAGKYEPFDPARDLVELAAQARAIGPVRLLVVDPVVSVVSGDSHKNGEVRRALQPLVALASILDAAVLGENPSSASPDRWPSAPWLGS